MLLSRYLVYFIIFSFLGWLYESLFYSFQFKKPVNTGFLRGCICPIYGLACLSNAVFLGKTESGALIFLLSMTGISAIEYTVSYLLERLFNKRWWDYSDWPVNINGRISLFSSLAFGLLSYVQLRYLHQPIMDFVMGLSENTLRAVVVMSVIYVALDVMLTLRDMDKENQRLWFLEETSPMICRAAEKVNRRARKLSDKCSDMYQRIRERIGR